jgi:hypothetical protein
MQTQLAMYPDAAVGVGDTWTRTQKLTQRLSAVATTVYTVKAMDDAAVVLDVATTLRADPESAGVDLGVFTQRAELSGEASGTITLDHDTGWPVASHIVHELEGVNVIEGENIPQGRMTIPVTIREETVVAPLEEPVALFEAAGEGPAGEGAADAAPGQ